jgi:hypothetical protein
VNDETAQRSPGVSTCSIIGSFRKHFPEALLARRDFESVGIDVLSPWEAEIVDPSAAFVRLGTDSSDHSDVRIQLIALHRILRSELVYVVDPGGYVGPTTAYEIGRVVDWKIPLYFSDHPRDLPILVSDEMIVSAGDLAVRLKEGGLAELRFDGLEPEIVNLHSALIERRCLSDEEIL